jgi:hypothetical protein
MFVKNSMSWLPLTPVVADRGAPVFGDPTWPWFAFGWSNTVSGDEGPAEVEDIIAVAITVVVLATTPLDAPPAMP